MAGKESEHRKVYIVNVNNGKPITNFSVMSTSNTQKKRSGFQRKYTKESIHDNNKVKIHFLNLIGQQNQVYLRPGKCNKKGQ